VTTSTPGGLDVLVVAMNYLPERSGTAPYTGAWAQHVAGEHTVTVLAGVPHYPEWRIHPGFGAWSDERREAGVTVRRLRHVVPSTPTAAARLLHETSFAARVLAQRDCRPDVVVAVSPPLFGAAAAASLARRLGVPFGLIVQDIYSEGVRELDAAGRVTAQAQRAMSAVERRVIDRADRVLTIHDRFASVLVDRLGLDPRRLDVVPNWTHVPSASTPVAEQRARLGWNDRFVVLHAGNMGVKQGLENVVDAARAAAADRDVPIHFVLMGDGNQRPLLERRATGVPHISFLPPADERTYPDILAAADVLLVNERPGVAEMSLPSKLTSYFAARRPVLAASGDGSATAAVVAASGGGRVVPPGRPDLLNDAIVRLARDPVGRAAMATRGAEYAAAHCSSTTAMAGYDRWLSSLTNRSPARVLPPHDTEGASA
jgi:glycosyltransferase involved in cell wall biosynthesis